jgi:hypothetical protein
MRPSVLCILSHLPMPFSMCVCFRSFNTNTNTIQTRISKEFSKALLGDDSPLATHYGALSGLGEMGVDVS